MSETMKLREMLLQIPEKAIEARKDLGAKLLKDCIEKVCSSHPSNTSSQVRIHYLEKVGKQIFKERLYYSSDEDINEMIHFAISNLLSELSKDPELLKISIESMESVYEEFEKYRSVFDDKISIPRDKNQKHYSKKRLKELFLAMPSIGIKARKTYSSIDLMDRIRKV